MRPFEPPRRRPPADPSAGPGPAFTPNGALPRHQALPYSGPAGFVPSCHEVVQEAVTGSRPVLVLAGEERLDGVRSALGGSAEDVTFVSTDRHGRNPARITALLDSFQSAGDGRHSVAVTDWSFPSRSSAAVAEAQLAESLLNAAPLQTWPLDVFCLYDTSTFTGSAMADMRRVHPAVRGEEANPDFAPELFDELFAAAINGDPVDVVVRDVGPAELSATRDLVRSFATAQGLSTQQVEDLVVAANEIVTNSIRHGGGTARVSLWEQGGTVICQVKDSGHITDPLAGRLAPAPGAESGRGLWLANQLCDLAQIRSSAAGTLVRLCMDRL